jgi:hypothetical protein
MLLNLAERWEFFAPTQDLAARRGLRDIKPMAKTPDAKPPSVSGPETPAEKVKDTVKPTKPVETGGPAGPEPTRYGDWERGGRCIDF